MSIQWDSPASLMRVDAFATADTAETLVTRGTLRELVGTALGLDAETQRTLLLRAVGADWTQEFDADAIRELAARPEYTGAYGAFDTAALDEDPDRQDELAVLETGDDQPADRMRQPGGSADVGVVAEAGPERRSEGHGRE